MRDLATIFLFMMGCAAFVILIGLLLVSLVVGEHVFIMVLVTIIALPILYKLTEGLL